MIDKPKILSRKVYIPILYKMSNYCDTETIPDHFKFEKEPTKEFLIEIVSLFNIKSFTEKEMIDYIDDVLATIAKQCIEPKGTPTLHSYIKMNIPFYQLFSLLVQKTNNHIDKQKTTKSDDENNRIFVDEFLLSIGLNPHWVTRKIVTSTVKINYNNFKTNSNMFVNLIDNTCTFNEDLKSLKCNMKSASRKSASASRKSASASRKSASASSLSSFQTAENGSISSSLSYKTALSAPVKKRTLKRRIRKAFSTAKRNAKKLIIKLNKLGSVR